jgi:hypothetical protein
MMQKPRIIASSNLCDWFTLLPVIMSIYQFHVASTGLAAILLRGVMDRYDP